MADRTRTTETRANLMQDLLEATARADEAEKAIDSIAAKATTIPPTDVTWLVKIAFQELAKARAEMMTAHNKLTAL